MSEWEEVKLKTICQGIYDGPHATPKRLDEGPVFLGISSLNRGSIDLSKSDHLSEKDFKKWTKRVTPQENDLVFSYETRLGEAALIPAGLRCCLGRRMALMRPDTSKVNPQFLLYAYLSPGFQATIKSRTVHGSTVNRIPLTELPDYPILIPSLETQNQIAATLSNLDRKIENLRRQNETLEEIAQSLFKHWFVDFEFPNADGKPYKSSGGEMVPSELGEIPAGWRVAPLQECLKHLIDNRGKTPEFFDTGIPALSAKFVKGGDLVNRESFNHISHELFEQSEKLEVGDVILTSEAPLGETFFIARETRYYPAQRVFALRANPEVISCSYLNYWLGSKMGQFLLQRRASGSTVQGIKQSELYQVEVIVPDTRILNLATEALMQVLVKKERNSHQIQTLTKTRDVLLPKLMSGKLRIKD